jgi:hypothetical protein
MVDRNLGVINRLKTKTIMTDTAKKIISMVL